MEESQKEKVRKQLFLAEKSPLVDADHLLGDKSRIWGNALKVWGYVSEIKGDVSGIEGDVSEIIDILQENSS